MKTITIKEGCSTPVCLGEKGENGVSAVLFNYSEWISDFGEGAISLLVKRKGDASAYPVVLTTADGIATWTISDTDTAVQGYGKAEYIFTIDDKIAKSAVFSFYVAADLGPAGDPPDPYESWIDTLTALGGETLINAQAAQAAQSGAEAAQTAAETAATNAATSATNAAQSAGAARFAAESALASADSASASATAASGHATAAETAKDLAISAAEDAQHSETQAELSASAAAESAESASGSATTATTAAQNASASATQSANNLAEAIEAAEDAEAAERTATEAAQTATTAAQNAAQSASAASGSATAAATSETNAAQSATSAEASAQEAATEAAKLNNYLPTDTASGSIASFSDGADDVPVKALSVALEPIQDLHGQSAPYPPGGGKNKFQSFAATKTINGVTFTANDDGTIKANGTATADIIYAFSETDPDSPQESYCRLSDMGIEADTTYKLSGDYSGAYNSTHWIQLLVYGSGAEPYSSYADSNPFTFTASDIESKWYRMAIRVKSGTTLSNITFEPMIRLSTVTDSTYAPYENICPISGFEQIAVTRTNSNLAVFWQNKYVDASGAFVSAASNGMCYPVRVKSGEYIRASYSSGANVGLALFADATLTRMVYRLGSGATYYRFVQDGYLVMWFNCGREASQAVLDELYCQFAVTSDSSLPTYETPNVQHVEIPLGQTVYGGSLDVVGGKVVVDRAMVEFDGTEGGWTNAGGNAPYSIDVVGITDYTNGAVVPNLLVNDRIVVSQNVSWSAYDALVSRRTGNVRLYFRQTSVSSMADWKAYLADNPVQVCYELATPIEIQLSDIPTISTLLGQNNIWSDSGDVDVTYRADIQKYIAKVIAEAIS